MRDENSGRGASEKEKRDRIIARVCIVARGTVSQSSPVDAEDRAFCTPLLEACRMGHEGAHLFYALQTHALCHLVLLTGVPTLPAILHRLFLFYFSYTVVDSECFLVACCFQVLLGC